jgi:hypothetical protein
MRKLILYSVLIIISINAYSQDYRYQKKDSVTTNYPYSLPLFGNFLHAAGVDLPYPVGIMVNSFYAVQDILIPDIAIGFSGGPGGADIPLTDITRLIEFSEIKATAYSLNFRPDIWILPFLNVYGIVGKAWALTDVQVSYPIELRALAELDGNSFGVGMTFAGGLGNYFVVVDGNHVWTNMKNFKEPVATRVLSLRLGRTFHPFKNPESNIGVWAGAMRVQMGGITEGTISLGEVLPPETWDKRDKIVDSYYTWYDNVDEMKQKAADKVLTPIIESMAASNGEATVKYKISKKPAQEWNMIIGGQYQIDKHWQVRAEGGILGNRKSLLISANYRFGIKHK